MRIIEIIPLSNGAHRNQTHNSLITVPDGWAVVPDYMDTPNFPFGEVVVEELNGVMTVVEWTPGIIPEPPVNPDAPEDEEGSVWDELDAAYQEGVNTAYDE